MNAAADSERSNSERTDSERTAARDAQDPNEVVIRFERVSKAFGSKVVLKDLDLEVRRGEALVIMGPSGTGKSVTLRHVIGLMKPDSGRVTVEGHDMSTITPRELADLRKRMGYLFQDAALINWLSVGDNVALPLRENTKLGEDEIRQKVIEKLETVKLPDVWDKMPAELSGGMRKRVGLARALITDPELILYDEPNAGLDPEISASINKLIRDVRDRFGITSVIISHLVSCVRTVADRVVLLDEGKVVLEGPRDEFLASDHPRLVRFLGDFRD